MKYDLIPNDINSSLELLAGFNKEKLPQLKNSIPLIKQLNPIDNLICLENILSNEEIELLIQFFNNNSKITTTKNTIKVTYGSQSNGIQRSSFYDKDFSIKLFERLAVYLNLYENHNYKKYEIVGFNPLIRFIYYKEGNKLVPHYDIPVNINPKENVTTLKTLVIYLNCSNSGSTNFLKDTRVNKEIDSFDSFPIIYKQCPQKGLGIIFDHGIFHESSEILKNEEKIIITTEICYHSI